MRCKLKIRYVILSVLLFITWGTQLIPFFGEFYAKSAYPTISYCLSAFSNLFPFAIGDLFIFLSIAGIILYPIYALPSEEDMETYSVEQFWVSIVGICMVLSGMGIELFTTKFLRTDRYSLYRLYSRKFSEIYRYIHCQPERFLYRYNFHQRTTCLQRMCSKL